MDSYLIRIAEQHWSSTQLLFFTDEDGLSGVERLTAYLRHLILLNEFSGLGPMIKTMWRWDKKDEVQELELKFITSVPEVDCVDWKYSLQVKSTGEEITRFTVRIEGD